VTTTATPSRVLVADDSGFMRRVIGASLRAQGFDVVGEAADGDEALALWERERPDCMTLDLAMPGRDGIAVLRELKGAANGAALPVVVVSAFSPAHGARAVDALAEGAFDLVEKPAIGEGLAPFTASLGEKVRAAAAAGSRAIRRARAVATGTGAAAPHHPPVRRARTGAGRVVLIASSTGGPRALADLVPHLPAPLGAGGLIVQHMPHGFTRSLAERLDRAGALRVAEAAGGEALDPGALLLAPGGRHLRLGADRRCRLSDDPPVGALRPRADLTIADAAALYRERLVLVVLTGMGRDGTEGARVVKANGGRVLVEAEETCTVYGMPRAVVEEGLADVVAPLHELPAAIAEEAWC
jgi:two-component system chemotaxis response regulator CheB